MAKLLLILILAWTAVDELASTNAEPPLLIDSSPPPPAMPLDAGK